MPQPHRIITKLTWFGGPIRRIAWSATGNLIAASAVENRHSCVWDVTQPQDTRSGGRFIGQTYDVTWSPDGDLVAFACFDGLIWIFDAHSGVLIAKLIGHSRSVLSVRWSPDAQYIVSGSSDRTVIVWSADDFSLVRVLYGHEGMVHCVDWSPKSEEVVSSSEDGTLRVWTLDKFEQRLLMTGHRNEILVVKWSSDGRYIASGSKDRTVRIWDPRSGALTFVLEGFTANVTGVSFSSDNQILGVKARDNLLSFWNTHTWEFIENFSETSPRQNYQYGGIAFHPIEPRMLASLDAEDTAVRVWQLGYEQMAESLKPDAIRYSNAKAILVGDSGVGKSGLGLVLSGQGFKPTDSTHGRHVWTFEEDTVVTSAGVTELREVLLWDLAGQPGYRIVHQLHLEEVAVALVVFDSRSDVDPFAGVKYWNRALNQAHRNQGNSAIPIKKFLVAARTDRGGISVSKERLERYITEQGFDGYFETSAREGWGIESLKKAIHEAINWDSLPKVSSTDLFQSIKDFLLEEKREGRLLSTIDDLYEYYLSSKYAPDASNLREEFDTVLGRVASRDLIRRLSFGNLVLLQPEFLDAYASGIVNTAKEEPDGLGSIAEDDARQGRFKMSSDERIDSKQLENLLLIATVEDMLRNELVLREASEDGMQLVFPSQFTRESPEYPDPEGKSVVFTFEGAIMNIYATLAVRLSHSIIYRKRSMWRNAALYSANGTGNYGMVLRELGEGNGELTIFFGDDTEPQAREIFEKYIEIHLKRRAIPESLRRLKIFECPSPTCRTPLSTRQTMRLMERGVSEILCPACGESTIRLIEIATQPLPATSPFIGEIDFAADERKEKEIAASVVLGEKIASNDFDVFLCHNSKDKPAVKAISRQLKDEGYLPWLDEEQLRPGSSWQKELEHQLTNIKTVAVFVGEDGIGPWQDLEIETFLYQFVKRRVRVIPVLLPNSPQAPKLPVMLQGITWVDFRLSDPPPFERLIWGISGEKPV